MNTSQTYFKDLVVWAGIWTEFALCNVLKEIEKAVLKEFLKIRYILKFSEVMPTDKTLLK